MTVKPISLKKQEIIDRWSALDPEQPIRLRPISTDHEGSSYDQDSIRITGSQEFIDSIIARLQGLLEYDSNGSRIEPMYVQTVERVKNEEGKLVPGGLTGSWAFYFKSKSRGNGKRGPRGPRRPSTVKPESMPQPMRIAKPDTPPRPVKPAKPKAVPTDEPVYAIASEFLDEEGNVDPVWVEPTEDHPYLKMDTYETHPECAKRIAEYRKQAEFKKAPLQIVQVEVNKKGKVIYTQV